MQISWRCPTAHRWACAAQRRRGPERVASWSPTLLRFHLIGAGAIACGVLAGNFGFVTGWTALILRRVHAQRGIRARRHALSVTHGLVVPAAVLGARLKIGFVTLVNGGLHIALALLLGRYWGLVGVAAATAISALLTSIPVGAKSLTELTRSTCARCSARSSFLAAPCRSCSAIALLAGCSLWRASVLEGWGRSSTLAAGLFAGGAVGVVYLFGVRPMMRDLPWDPDCAGSSALCALFRRRA